MIITIEIAPASQLAICLVRIALLINDHRLGFVKIMIPLLFRIVLPVSEAMNSLNLLTAGELLAAVTRKMDLNQG